MDLLRWTVVLSIVVGAISAPGPFNAPIGGSVFLYGDTLVESNHQINWKINTGAAIATRLPGSSSTYSGRCAAGKCELFPNGTLRMDALATADNRSYSVTFILQSVSVTEVVQLNVYNRLTPPTLELSSLIRPVNGTTLNLRCNAGSQTVHRIHFYHNQQVMSCNPSHLSCNESSPFLYFNPIIDSDSGIYSCVIQNPVSTNSSAFVTLDVAVKVSGVTLRNSATSPVTVERDAVTLTCSSYGTEVSYSWRLMGSPLPQNPRYQLTNNTSTLIINPVSRSDQGSFICTVSNYLNTENSNALNLTWSPDGNIKCGAERLAQSVQFSCSWPGGYPPALVHMSYHDLSQVGPDGVIVEVPYNQLSLRKQMSCNGTHVNVSSDVCSLMIDIPQSVGFVNDSLMSGTVGTSVHLTVTLSSNKTELNLQPRVTQIFPAKFSWFRLDPNPSELSTEGHIFIISNDYSSVLIVSDMTKELIGRYMCKAENTMGSNVFTFILDVTAEGSPDGNIKCGAERLAQTVQFSCSWPGGYPPALVQMLYHDLSQVGPDGVIVEVPYNQLSLGKQMSCNGTHVNVSSDVCSLMIDIPQSVGFVNDSLMSGTVGSNVRLTVTLRSSKTELNLQPRVTQIFPAKFSWFRLEPNMSELSTEEHISIDSNDYSSVLIVSYMTKELIGRYMCKAENIIGSNVFTFILDVTAEGNTDNSLSAGAIAGIVIGSIAVVVLIALIFVRCKPKYINEDSDVAQRRTNTTPTEQVRRETQPVGPPNSSGPRTEKFCMESTGISGVPSDLPYMQLQDSSNDDNQYQRRLPRTPARPTSEQNNTQSENPYETALDYDEE